MEWKNLTYLVNSDALVRSTVSSKHEWDLAMNLLRENKNSLAKTIEKTELVSD